MPGRITPIGIRESPIRLQVCHNVAINIDEGSQFQPVARGNTGDVVVIELITPVDISCINQCLTLSDGHEIDSVRLESVTRRQELGGPEGDIDVSDACQPRWSDAGFKGF